MPRADSCHAAALPMMDVGLHVAAVPACTSQKLVLPSWKQLWGTILMGVGQMLMLQLPGWAGGEAWGELRDGADFCSAKMCFAFFFFFEYVHVNLLMGICHYFNLKSLNLKEVGRFLNIRYSSFKINIRIKKPYLS